MGKLWMWSRFLVPSPFGIHWWPDIAAHWLPDIATGPGGASSGLDIRIWYYRVRRELDGDGDKKVIYVYTTTKERGRRRVITNLSNIATTEAKWQIGHSMVIGAGRKLAGYIIPGR